MCLDKYDGVLIMVIILQRLELHVCLLHYFETVQQVTNKNRMKIITGLKLFMIG